MRLDIRRCSLALARPLRSSYGSVSDRQLLAVCVTDSAGVSGHGEAAPLPAYGGPGIERVWEALERYRKVLSASGELPHAQLMGACRSADDLPAALAAIDIALWDLAARVAGEPVAALLCERPARDIAVNALIDALDPGEALEQAAAAAREGFTCVKVKVGVGDDDERVSAVRAGAGAMMAVRVDANGAWDVEEAVKAIAALEPARLELVEEPVHGVAGIREVRERVGARIAIDETAAERGALAAGAADAVCLKVARCGGISGLLDAARAVRASGAEPYVASTLDGPIGTAAALHAAAALAAEGRLPHCGLATLALFSGIEDQLPVRAGAIAVPSRHGLGVDPL